MTTLVVSYDLMKQGQDYNSLIKELRRLGGKRVLASTWTLQTNSVALELLNHLKRLMDANDRIFVAAMSAWAWYRPIEEPHKAQP